MTKLIIGIDPGVHTGFAVVSDGKLINVCSKKACEAEAHILAMIAKNSVMIYYEDARLRKWFGEDVGRSRLQGAGSVKRDCQRWEEWLTMHDIPHVAVAPRNNRTKMDADAFKRLTGWPDRTNEHGRDASMLIWGRT